jgi:hypothetical protein
MPINPNETMKSSVKMMHFFEVTAIPYDDAANDLRHCSRG